MELAFACLHAEFSGTPGVQGRSPGPLGQEGNTVLAGSSRAEPFDGVFQGLLEVQLPDLRQGVRWTFVMEINASAQGLRVNIPRG